MKNVGIYLNFQGNTEEAFNFYAKALNTKIDFAMKFKDTPDGGKMSLEEQEKMMHISLTLANGVMLMGTDALESMGQKLTMGNNTHIYVDTKDEAEADTIFVNLSEGGTVDMKLEKTFWGAYFGSLKDKFGVQWMVSYTYPHEAK